MKNKDGGQNMERIQFIMETDSMGRITVKNVLQYINNNLPQIEMPKRDITEICLLNLSMNGKNCSEGYLEYINGKQYKITLIFR